MSNKPKEGATNRYDKIREEMRQKQQPEIERKQKTISELFNQPKGFHEWAREQNGQPADIHDWISRQNKAEQKGDKTNE